MKKLIVIVVAGLFLVFNAIAFGQTKSNQRKTKPNNIAKPTTSNSIKKPGKLNVGGIKESMASSRKGKPRVKPNGITGEDEWETPVLRKGKPKRGKRN